MKHAIGERVCILRFTDADNKLQFMAPEEDVRHDDFERLQDMTRNKETVPDDLLAKFDEIPIIDVLRKGRLGTFSIEVEKKGFAPKYTQRPPWL